MNIKKILSSAIAAVVASTALTAVSAEASVSKQSAVQQAAAASKRSKALSHAKTQNKDRYCYGGNGPSCWDCSGLVVWAYKKVGISLPRTSGDIRNSSKTVHVSRYKALPGDLVFRGHGHVEFLAKKPYKKNGKWYTQTFGAGSSKTGVRYQTVSGVPHIEHVKGAG